MNIKQGQMLRIGGKLGEGRVFEVFEVLEFPSAPLGSRLVLKRIRAVLLADEAFRNRLQKLFELLPRLRQSYAEEVLEAKFNGAEDASIVCERIDGETLAAMLRREGRLPLDVACSLGRQIAEAVAEGHGLGIVHGNLTPNHIIITQPRRADRPPQLRIKVRGFGLAPPLSPGLYGTANYLAPEQLDTLLPRPQATPLSDQHALAVLIYESLVGRMLFPQGTLEAVRPRLLRQDPPYFELRNVSQSEVRRVNGALQRALAKGSESRFERLLDLIETLEGTRPPSRLQSIFVERQPEPPRPSPPSPPPPIMHQALPPVVAPSAVSVVPLVESKAVREAREERDLREVNQSIVSQDDIATIPHIRIVERRRERAVRYVRPLLRVITVLLFGGLVWLIAARSKAVADRTPLLAPPPPSPSPSPKIIVEPLHVVPPPPKIIVEPLIVPPASKPPEPESPSPSRSRRTKPEARGVTASSTPIAVEPAHHTAPVKQKPSLCRPEKGVEDKVLTPLVRTCLDRKISRDLLRGIDFSVMYSARKHGFVVDVTEGSESVGKALEECLSRSVNSESQTLEDGDQSWSCR